MYFAHGSYGSCLYPLMELHDQWNQQIERNPNKFFYKTLYPNLIRSIQSLADFLKVQAQQVVLVRNVEYGIQSVMNSILEPKDVIVCFDFNYEAIKYSIQSFCTKYNCTLLMIPTTMPITNESLIDSFSKTIQNQRIRLAIVEHITSPSAIIIPIKELGDICKAHEILFLVDGAHGLGQISLSLQEWNVDFYTSNLHKWMNTPRGCAFLYMKQVPIKPLVTSWGYNQGVTSEFLWQGTDQYTPYLCIPMAIHYRNLLDPFYQQALELVEWTNDYLTRLWNTTTLVEQKGILMTSIILPIKECNDSCQKSTLHDDLERVGIVVPIFTFKQYTCMRISIHIYNTRHQVQSLGQAFLDLEHSKVILT
jgi:isopenicillin-N epimerase